jgi:hypothetical protein
MKGQQKGASAMYQVSIVTPEAFPKKPAIHAWMNRFGGRIKSVEVWIERGQDASLLTFETPDPALFQKLQQALDQGEIWSCWIGTDRPLDPFGTLLASH